jgi:hypothetical protein
MESHGTLEIFPRHVLEWADLDDACVVDQDIDLAEVIDDLPNRRPNLLCIKQVAFNPENIRGAAAPGNVRFCAPEFLRIARYERDLSACRGDLSRKHEPKSA